MVVEAIARGCASTASVFVAHTAVTGALTVAGTDEQKSRFLPGLAAGRRLGAYALTESASGTNHFATATKAMSNGDGFVVNGTKSFTTSSE